MSKTKTLVILFFGLFTVQFSYGQLNKQIDKSQKEAILKSPFKTAKGMTKEISRQKVLRPEYLKIIDSLRLESPKDTIILTENYDFICVGCSADYIQIQVGEMLISLRKSIESKVFERKNTKFAGNFVDESGYYNSDLNELRNEINRGDNWAKNLEKYGTEYCFDGGHTFYTVIYPDNKVISMYMRCWVDKEMRK